MQPIFFKPVYKDYIWGGNKIKDLFKKDTPYEKTAESWEIAANKNGKSIVKNGVYKGMNLQELFEKKEIKEQIFGSRCKNYEKFPLLIKFIDAKTNLSVQVHPDDEYANKNEDDIGKTEVWYIMDCEPNSKIVCGIEGEITEEEIENGKIEQKLKYIPIQKYHSIYIPSGTVHAILGGTLLCEIQQNSDLTYRVYDWKRVDKDGKPRKLHIQKAMDVINVKNKPEVTKTLENKDKIQTLVKNQFFTTQKIKISNEYKDTSNAKTFYAINVVKGEGKIIYKGKQYKLNLADSFIIPANLGEYKIIGELEILKSYI